MNKEKDEENRDYKTEIISLINQIPREFEMESVIKSSMTVVT